ncbi:MAG: alpha-mannosidase [Spirochaetes bacterium]|nr:alpha-mannosidase [Spirochaetota bacterium]
MKKLENERMKQARNFAKRVSGLILTGNLPFTAEYHKSMKHIPLKESISLNRTPIAEGATWGETWESGYFRLTGAVPKEWKGKTVAAHIDLNGETLVYSKEGVPLYGLTNGSVFSGNYSKDVYRIFEPCKGGEQVELFLEAAANGLFGVNRDPNSERSAPTRHGNYKGEVKHIRLCMLDETMWHLYLDLTFLVDLAMQFDEDNVRRSRIVKALYESMNVFADDPVNADKTRAVLKPVMASKNGGTALTSISVGHAHIDTGWLWRIEESVRKTARTFASQIANIERYPGFVFGASQAQLYKFVKDHYPELHAKVKKAIRDGSWEVQGGMWVEADCNLISGESMVRQFVHGKNFFKDEYGVDVKNLWLPDVFGYSANLPQILKRSGIDFFLTQKISWSQFNVFRHNTFIWRGIDGSEVITHFPPEDNYNSPLTPGVFRRAERNFKEKAFLDEYMTLAGIGNGGGGPKEEHIESGLRLTDSEGMPKNKFGRADGFFERLAKRSDELSTFVGELYLELHRATLTTQARTKRYNRLLENRLRQTEAVASLLPLGDYPREKLEAIWQMLLTNQFHDIIPGSSINLVYQDAHAAYEKGLADCDVMIADAAKKVFTKDENALSLMNITSYSASQPVVLPAAWKGAGVERADGKPVAVQLENGVPVIATDIAPYETVVLKRTAKASEAAAGNDLTLENDIVRYTFDKNGTLVDAFDKEAKRPVLASGAKANVFSLYADHPNNWDAWDIDFNYTEQLLETAKCVSIKKTASGPVRSVLSVSMTIGHSKIEQTVSLDKNSKRLMFTSNVAWDEAHRMLRVAFPVNVVSTEASFDIQYGFVKRSTHENTSLDFAQFEVVGHRYADLSANDYGVALLNDCKYGYKVKDNIIDLNILRSPRDPDPDADIGNHVFTYALLPHNGTLIESSVMAEAEALNVPPVMLAGFAANHTALPATVTGDGVSITAVKKAEKEECHIVRIVETCGKHTTAVLKAAGTVTETNLMEWENGAKLDAKNGAAIELSPFEIRTYKVK